MMTTTDLRKSLTKKYWRSVLWIDDDIKPSSTEAALEEYLNFFVRITREFAKEGIICHLKEFEQITSDGNGDVYSNGDEEVKSCENLAKQADILILDWALGADNPIHSNKIIEALIKDGGNRIIIVLSKETQLSESFNQNFGDRFKSEGEWLQHNDGGIFVLLLRKSDFKSTASANALYETIYSKLASVYPDYLHWAAIEIAGKIKSHTHSWLASLPVQTDLAILAEALHSSENVGAVIKENLFEDLKESVNSSSIKSTNSSNFTSTNWIPYAKASRKLNDELAPKRSITEKETKRSVEAIDKVHPLWLDPRKLVHSGWDDFPIKKGNHHEKNEKDSGANHPYLA